MPWQLSLTSSCTVWLIEIYVTYWQCLLRQNYVFAVEGPGVTSQGSQPAEPQPCSCKFQSNFCFQFALIF